ncbi:uncharacterized protein LOC129792003 [Lutzomyia longipalpis]|uniref:uncharacterized protein LOC129792003 n=1 Tax=Lutzomyia longipalpis TaxID=7200 RepID=UPI0024842AF5|nr:uncharacterized protein LOC129792003 [Lutzomyia longipalpis]
MIKYLLIYRRKIVILSHLVCLHNKQQQEQHILHNLFLFRRYGNAHCYIIHPIMQEKQERKSEVKKNPGVKDEKEIEFSPEEYAAVCRKRYYRARLHHQEEYLEELQLLEESQPSAYEAMRFHRNFAVTTIWPPLHRDVELVLKHTHRYTGKDDARLKELLKYRQC